MDIQDRKFKIIVKTNAKENTIVGYDKEKEAYLIDIKAKPEDNKANLEIIKFLSKSLKKRVIIKSGLKSKEKIIEVI
jgi:uncharacterized protein (TIGR00251 family)